MKHHNKKSKKHILEARGGSFKEEVVYDEANDNFDDEGYDIRYEGGAIGL